MDIKIAIGLIDSKLCEFAAQETKRVKSLSVNPRYDSTVDSIVVRALKIGEAWKLVKSIL